MQPSSRQPQPPPANIVSRSIAKASGPTLITYPGYCLIPSTSGNPKNEKTSYGIVRHSHPLARRLGAKQERRQERGQRLGRLLAGLNDALSLRGPSRQCSIWDVRD